MANNGSGGSVKITSTTERLYKAGKFSKATGFADRKGPVNASGANLTKGAPIKTAVRGILKQMNVGDVPSVVDKLNDATSSYITGKGNGVDTSA